MIIIVGQTWERDHIKRCGCKTRLCTTAHALWKHASRFDVSDMEEHLNATVTNGGGGFTNNFIFLFWCGDSSMQFVAELNTLETCWHCSSGTLLYVRTTSRLWWPVWDIMRCIPRIRVELKSRRSVRND